MKTDFIIVEEYMQKHYPNQSYNMQLGNDCIWVSMRLTDMYFVINNNKIIDIQVE